HDPLREVVLQREGELVVHVHLDRHQEEAAHAQDRDALHAQASAVRAGSAFARASMCEPVRLSATTKASARLDLVITCERSTPRCTMVCAICGRMPLMMQSAPMRR